MFIFFSQRKKKTKDSYQTLADRKAINTTCRLNAVCFFCACIEERDSEEMAREKRIRMDEDTIKYPNDYIELIDHKRNYRFISYKGIKREIPYNMNEQIINRSCVLKALHQLKDEGKIKRNYYFSYIWRILEEGNECGQGFNNKTYKDFRAYLRDFSFGENSNILDNKPSGNKIFPNWFGPEDLLDSKNRSIINFVNEFICKYKVELAKLQENVNL